MFEQSEKISMSESIIRLPKNSFYSLENKTLYCVHNSGYFSNCSVTLWGLIELYKQNILPENINFSYSFIHFKTQEQISYQVDVYPNYFRYEPIQIVKVDKEKLLRHDHHGLYVKYTYDVYNLFIAKYFSLSSQALENVNNLLKKYKINPSETIAVCYRGTDKSREVKLATPEAYLKTAKQILKQNPNFKILIQTDQKQVRDLFLHHFQDQCIFFEEMPVTEGKRVLHLQGSETIKVSKFEFGLRLLAVTHLISRCRWIVNHTGNMAAWICLFRGNADNIFQFNNKGHLINSWNQLYWNVFEYFMERRKVKKLLKTFW